MTAFLPGDRVQIRTTGEDGYPLMRYGFIGSCWGGDGPVVVMFDDEMAGSAVVDVSQLVEVSIDTVELLLEGSDLIDDPDLRQGLVHLWFAEAEQAGLEISAFHPIIGGLRDSSEGYVIAELNSAGQHYVLRAIHEPHSSGEIRVRADRPNRWDF
jgi:hypothetical protein